MYKLTLFIPQSPDDGILDLVKSAIFEAGAGNIGNYAECCWQVLGMGQFKPQTGSKPFMGETNHLESVPEWRVECVVADEHINAVVAAMKAAHPYETPAYDVVKLIDI